MTLVLLTFLGVGGFVFGLCWLLVFRPEAGVRKSMQKRLRPQEEATRKGRLTIARAEQEAGLWLFRDLQNTINQSGRKTTVPKVLFTCAISGIVSGFVADATTGLMPLALVVGAAAMTVPYLLLRRAATVRMWKFEEQFPDAIDLIARALRAGHAFPPGLAMVAEELGDPVGPEFKLLYDRQNFGMPMPDAMRAFAQRVPVIDAKFFVTAVLTQREAGGNLSGVLDNLSAVIRERFKVKRQVRVISAHGRMTAAVLAGLPPVIGVAQMFIAPQNWSLVMHDPLGQKMLVGAAVLQGIGMFWISRIVKVEY